MPFAYTIHRWALSGTNTVRFTIERVVTNWDTEYLEGRLHSLIASTNYRGQVEISFPLTHNKVVLKSSYKQRDILTNLANLFSSTRKYGVVQVVWPYASVKPGVDGRQFAVQSEENWWADWKDAIRGAVLGRRNGWVTVEDQLEVLMNMNRVAGSASEWGGY